MVFHFNKKHLEDPTVPMWVIKAKGESYYVEHVDCMVNWSTKETPDNSHTKGSIKIKDCLLVIDDDNCAKITTLYKVDAARLRNQELGIVRIITRWSERLREALKLQDVRHGPIKAMGGGCGSTFYVTDLLDKEEATAFLLFVSGSSSDVRVLKPNETYYKAYDDPEYLDEIEDDY